MSRRGAWASHAILLFFSVIALAPIALTFVMAFNPAGASVGGFALPSSPSLSAFESAWTEGQLNLYLRSSLIVTPVVVTATAVLSVFAGYAFALLPIRFKGLLFGLLMLGMIIPFEALVIPLYYDFRDLGLTDTYWALILPQTAIFLSFGTFWMRSFFRTTPPELVDAARVDGASPLRILLGVLLPLARPAVLSMAVLVFIWCWNEFLLPLVMISDEHLRTAPLGISYFQGRFGTDVTSMAAAGVIVAAPAIVVYFTMQRRLTSGILQGGVKG